MNMRLQKVLAQAGIASRRKAESLIAEGRVEVNGEVVCAQGVQVDPDRDLVRLDGRLLELERKVYYVLYKPPEVVTTLADPQGRPTIAPLIDAIGERVFAVGRLDYDAEGALIVTNDGALAHRLMHPSFGVPRVYLAKVKGVPDDAVLDQARRGLRLEDGLVTPIEIERGESAEKNTWLKIVLAEGRPHLVKRLCAALGHPVLRLYRPIYGGVSAEGLRPGQFRPLLPAEISLLKNGGRRPVPRIADLKAPPRRHRAQEGKADGIGQDMSATHRRAQKADSAAAPGQPKGKGGARRGVPEQRRRHGASPPTPHTSGQQSALSRQALRAVAGLKSPKAAKSRVAARGSKSGKALPMSARFDNQLAAGRSRPPSKAPVGTSSGRPPGRPRPKRPRPMR